MSNVTQLHGSTYVEPSSPFPQDSPLYFTAVERPLKWQHKDGVSHFLVDTHKMLLRANDQQFPIQLAVVGEGWQMVQNKELFQGVEEQFIEAFSPDELNGVRVRDSMSYAGRMCLREYQFPNVRCDSPGVSDIAFRTIVKNGFGGSSIALYTGAIDFFCTNGMISGKYDCMYARHTKGLRLTDITQRVRRSIKAFYENNATWWRWYGNSITIEEAKVFLLDRYSERLAEKLLRQYRIETHSHGENMWALYSAMTYYATHDEGDFATRNTGVDHSATTLLKREEQVQSVIASDAWLRLAA